MNNDHILDAWRYNKMFNYWSNPLVYYNCEKTVESRNCDIIENKLRSHCIPVQYVARHSVFGINYFELVMKKDADKIVYEGDICKIFDIPRDWVGFVSTNPQVLCIKEDELLEKYADCDGVLKFKCDWSIKGKSNTAVKQKLKESGINARVSGTNCGCEYYYTIVLDCNASSDYKEIAEALNISKDDVGVCDVRKSYFIKR